MQISVTSFHFFMVFSRLARRKKKNEKGGVKLATELLIVPQEIREICRKSQISARVKTRPTLCLPVIYFCSAISPTRNSNATAATPSARERKCNGQFDVITSAIFFCDFFLALNRNYFLWESEKLLSHFRKLVSPNSRISLKMRYKKSANIFDELFKYVSFNYFHGKYENYI